MLFGLSGALETFQYLMDRLLQGMWEYAAAYLDDVVIYNMIWERHLTHLQKVLE